MKTLQPDGKTEILPADAEGSISAEVAGYAFVSLVDCPSCGHVLAVTNSHRQRGDTGKYVMCENHDCAAHLKLWKRPMVDLIEAFGPRDV